VDDIDLGYLMAVAGALVWTPRPLRSWLDALQSPRAIIAFAKSGEPRPPEHAEPLGAEAIGRLAAIDDEAARQALEECRRCGARALIDTGSDYPPALRDLCDPPPVLYARGDPAVLFGRTVAIVGSRAATSYGRNIAGTLAAEFGSFGACVVSGLARGIDAAAHKGAIAARVPTAAVIGSGLAALYPPYHSLLADEIADEGGVVLSEFPPALGARAHQFPMRNRLVAALAQATVVVEAGSRSGALITARLADEIGRPVFAIPGDVGRAASEGSNELIKDGVTLVTCAADVAGTLGWNVRFVEADDTDTRDPVLALVDSCASGIEELSARSRLDVASLLAKLTLLEIQGLVKRLPGGSYAAVKARRPPNPRAR
jgi:DNA processing protein